MKQQKWTVRPKIKLLLLASTSDEPTLVVLVSENGDSKIL